MWRMWFCPCFECRNEQPSVALRCDLPYHLSEVYIRLGFEYPKAFLLKILAHQLLIVCRRVGNGSLSEGETKWFS